MIGLINILVLVLIETGNICLAHELLLFWSDVYVIILLLHDTLLMHSLLWCEEFLSLGSFYANMPGVCYSTKVHLIDIDIEDI